MKSNILNRFCDPTANAEYKQEPFINGEYIIGTDSHICGYIKKELVEDANEYKTLTKDYIGQLMKVKGPNTYNLPIKIDSLVDAVKSVECDNENQHLCPDCKGAGVVEFEYTSMNDFEYTITDTCPVCNGDGFSKEYDYLSLTSGWFNKFENYIDIGGCLFNPCYMEKLAFAMSDCNVTTCTFVCGGPTNGCCFNITDGFNIIVMPSLIKDKEEKKIIKLETELQLIIS